MTTVVDGVPVALAPPDGYVVNFDHPRRNSVPAAYWLYGVGNFLMLLSILLRVYVRAVIQKAVKIEDAFLGVAFVFSVVLQTLIIRDFANAIMGTHAWEMPISKFAGFARALYLLPILYNPVQCGAKMSLLIVYQRLAPQKWYLMTVRLTMCVVIGASIAITFATIFPCKPVRAGWDITIVDSKCINRNALYEWTAILGAITDAMVLAVPIPIVVPLQISLRQKIGVICFLGIGVVTVFTSIMRLVALVKSMGVVDETWGGGPVLLWVFAEANLSVICATLPTIKLFTKAVFPRILGTSSGGTSKGSKSFGKSVPVNIEGSTSEPTQVSRHDGYERFDCAYPLKTMTNIESGVADGHRYERHLSDSQQDDSGSEKAIVQTTTTIVSYS